MLVQSFNGRRLVHLVVGPEADQEAHVPVPPEEHTHVVINAERPVVGQVAFQLVSSEQRILRIRREAPQRRAQQSVARCLQLTSAAQEP